MSISRHSTKHEIFSILNHLVKTYIRCFNMCIPSIVLKQTLRRKKQHKSKTLYG